MASTIQKTLYLNLKLLEFDRFSKKLDRKDGFQFHSKMFEKTNQKAFESMTYFLLTTLDKENKKLFNGCYPCLDRKQEADFRKITTECFKKLEKEKDSRISFLPLLLHNPVGDQFSVLYIALSNYVLTKNIKKKFGVHINFDSFTDPQAVELIMEQCKQYEKMEMTLMKTREFWKVTANAFLERHRYLRSTQAALKERLTALNSKFNEEDSHQSLKQLQTLSEEWATLALESKQLQKECRTSSSTLDSRGNLLARIFNPLECVNHNHSFKQIDISLFSVSEQSLLDYLEFVKNMSLSELTKIKERIEVASVQLVKHNEATHENLKNVIARADLLDEECERLRQDLLQDSRIQRRRSWFKERLPNPIFPVIVFEPMKPTHTASRLAIESPEYPKREAHRRSDYEYSFRFAEISTFNYVAPSAVEQGYFNLSPLHELTPRKEGHGHDLTEEILPSGACD